MYNLNEILLSELTVLLLRAKDPLTKPPRPDMSSCLWGCWWSCPRDSQSTLVFEMGVSPWTWSLLILLDWLANNLQKSSCLCIYQQWGYRWALQLFAFSRGCYHVCVTSALPAPGASSVGSLISSWGPYPRGLITSQRPSVLVLSLSGSDFTMIRTSSLSGTTT